MELFVPVTVKVKPPTSGMMIGYMVCFTLLFVCISYYISLQAF